MSQIDALWQVIKAAADADGLVLSASADDSVVISAAELGKYIQQLRLLEQASVHDSALHTTIKVLQEVCGLLEKRSINVSRAVSDSTGVTEQAKPAISKSFVESGLIAEQHSTEFNANWTQTSFELLETAEKTAVKKFGDTSLYSDIASISANKIHSDGVTLGEVAVNRLAKILSGSDAASTIIDLAAVGFHTERVDNFSSTDRASLGTSKSLQDASVSMSDGDVYTTASKVCGELAFLAEVVYTVTSRLLANNVPVSDSLGKLAYKSRREKIFATDFGLVRSQSYCDFSYISEDYVGKSWAF